MPARHHSRPTHIVIADDHALFRAGVKTILKDEPDLEIVGEADDGSNLCRLVEDKKADVLLLDLAMPHTDGHEVLRQLKISRSSVNALVLSASDDRVDLSLALDLGAKGIVSKRAATKSLLEAIRRVGRGEIWVDPQFVDLGLKCEPSTRTRRRQSMGPPPKPTVGWECLTPREKQIASRVAQGLRYREIAKRLHISEQTVRNHLRNIFDKLQINDRVRLALFTIDKQR